MARINSNAHRISGKFRKRIKSLIYKAITTTTFLPQGWRVCYYGAGVLAVIIAVLTGTTLKEPERKAIGEEDTNQSNRKKVSLWKVLTQPRVILLTIAASIRHCGGMTFAYNADLYYSIYFPDVDLGWWLFAVTIGIGTFKSRANLIAPIRQSLMMQNDIF